VNTEAQEGLERNILVPALLDEVRIPLTFRRTQCADLQGWPNSEHGQSGFERLVDGVALTLGKVAVEHSVEGVTHQVNDAPPSREADPPSITVLPFKNMSDDREQEYLADGMTEELINLLSRIPVYRISARNSSFAYKDKSPDVRSVGQELDVRYVVEGSIRRVGGNIRVTAQLIRSSDGNHVWSETFDRPIADIFDVQDEVVEAIARTLQHRIGLEEQSRIRRIAPESLDAWGLLIRAEQIPSRGRRSRDERLSLIQQSLEIDPEYARANTMMARTLAGNANMSFSRRSEVTDEKVEHYARLALENGQSDPDILMGVALAFMSLGDREHGLPLAERARKQFGKVTTEYVRILGEAGYIDEAIEGWTKLMDESASRDADPVTHNLNMSGLYAIKGDYEEALFFAIRAHEVDPTNFYLPLGYLANIYGHLGRFDEAQEAWAKLKKILPTANVKAWQDSYQTLYGTEEAVEALTGGFRKAGIVD
jgi:adenylate cyclase